jgi:transposase
MVEALIAGERDPAVLADMSKSRMRAKKDQLALALDGNFGAHHGVVARQIIDHIAFLDASIKNLSDAIVERLGAFEAMIGLLCEIPGWGRATAEVFIAETGGDMRVFPTPEQLASWAGVAPGTHESAGKRRAMNGNRWLGRTLIEAARAAARTKGTFLSARYRRLVSRRGPNKAAVAVAHTMVVTAWHMLTTGEAYRELGDDYYTKRQDPDRQARRLTRELEHLGFTVTIKPAA